MDVPAGLRIRPFRVADADDWASTEFERSQLVDAVVKSGAYLAAVQQDGRIVGKIGIRYDEHPGAGSFYQFDVVEDLRGRGIGTTLLSRAEQVVADHGCGRATLGVEDSNAGAIRLYHRRGYRVFGSEDAEWDQQAPDGTTSRYRCRCLLMERDLAEPRRSI